MNINDFEKNKIYSEASGVIPVADKNFFMELNEFGIYEEKVHSQEKFNSDILEKVSPNFNKDTDESEVAKKLYSDIPGIKHNEQLGYYLDTYVGYVKEGDYRKNASSGGLGTWIFAELFNKDLIDGVIHVKENTSDTSDVLFKYDISRTIDEIAEGAKTRYYPVELSEVLELVKDNPGRYAIIGIPSFIYAVRLLQEYDPIFKERIVYTIGLLCGHQKSTKFAEYMGWQVGIKPGDLEKIDFRYKLEDRPASNYGIRMTGLVDGERKTIIKPKDELLGQDWGLGIFKVYASDYIDDVMNETADITIGDAWIPPYNQDPKGTNVVIVRDPVIQNILLDGTKEGRLSLEEVDKDLILKSQAAHFRHNRDELKYRLQKKDRSQQWRPKKRVDANHTVIPIRQKIQDIRTKISSSSHILYKEAVEIRDKAYFEKKMNKLLASYDRVYSRYHLIRKNYRQAFHKILLGIKRLRNI